MCVKRMLIICNLVVNFMDTYCNGISWYGVNSRTGRLNRNRIIIISCEYLHNSIINTLIPKMRNLYFSFWIFFLCKIIFLSKHRFTTSI